MTAAYNTERDKHGRQVQWLVEIDLDRCDEVYTQGSCTASDVGDGSRCWYSYLTCQDQANYNRTTKTYRFCLRGPEWPDNTYQVYPLLAKFAPVPQEISDRNLDTYPELMRLQMHADHTPPIQDHDKGDGYYNTTTAGEFWRNLVARNPNYAGRALRIYRGFAATGFTYSDFAQVGPEYLLKAIKIGRTSVMVEAESPLAKLRDRKAPWPISKDNVLTADVTDSDLTWPVTDGSEFPDPQDYAEGGGRNKIYVKCASEIAEVTAITGNDLTVVRGIHTTIATAHSEDEKVFHVLVVGTDNGAATWTGIEPTEVMQDLLEWAGVAAADVDDTSFDRVKAGGWPEKDVLTVVDKPQKISTLMRELRESRGIILFINPSAKWACELMAPGDSTTALTEDNCQDGTVEVIEDEETRVTRASLYYQPRFSGAKEPADFRQVVIVIDANLESANMYGDQRERSSVNAWVDPGTAVSKLRNLCRRQITRNRAGTRTIKFRLELKDAALNVGDFITFKTRFLLGINGEQTVRQCILIAKKEISESVTEYKAVDLNAGGSYLKIGPDTMADDYGDGTETDRAYGYWGDTNGRVGDELELKYIYW